MVTLLFALMSGKGGVGGVKGPWGRVYNTAYKRDINVMEKPSSFIPILFIIRRINTD